MTNKSKHLLLMANGLFLLFGEILSCRKRKFAAKIWAPITVIMMIIPNLQHKTHSYKHNSRTSALQYTPNFNSYMLNGINLN